MADKEKIQKTQRAWDSYAKPKTCYNCQHCNVTIEYENGEANRENWCLIMTRRVDEDATCSEFEKRGL